MDPSLPQFSDAYMNFSVQKTYILDILALPICTKIHIVEESGN